jgi:hypothetical protein
VAIKKKLSKKVKQVASRAKAAPRVEPNVPSDYITASKVKEMSAPVDLSNVFMMEGKEKHTAFMTGHNENVIEFSPMEPHEVAARNAIERSKKVDLKVEIREMMNTFKTDINVQLNNLSERIEAQLKPLVQTVADIAVAKKDMEGQLISFGERLSATLNLNDELEPIEIEHMFAPNPLMDNEMSGYETDAQINEEDDDGMELLAEATEFASEKGDTPIN